MMMEQYVKIKDFVSDIRVGMAYSELIEKYRLSLLGLMDALDQLVRSKAIQVEELRKYIPLEQQNVVFSQERQLPRSFVHARIVVHDTSDAHTWGIITNISEQGFQVSGIRAAPGDLRKFLVEPRDFPAVGTFALEAECRWSEACPDGSTVSGFRVSGISEKAGMELHKLVAVLNINEQVEFSWDARDISDEPFDLDVEISKEADELQSIFTTNVSTSGSFDLRMGVTSLGLLLDSLPIFCFLVDRTHHVVFANDGSRMLEENREGLIGRSFLSFFPDDADRVKSLMGNAYRRRTVILFRSVVQVGNRRLFGVVCLRSIRAGANRFLLVTLQDLTQEIQAVTETKARANKFLMRCRELERRLEESRITSSQQAESMSAILNSLEQRIMEEKEGMSLTLRTHVKPIIEHLKAEKMSDHSMGLLNSLQDVLDNMLSISELRVSRLYAALTPRETEICDMILSGHSSKEISEALGISYETVGSHRSRIRRKLGLGGGSHSLSGWLRGQLELPGGQGKG